MFQTMGIIVKQCLRLKQKQGKNDKDLLFRTFRLFFGLSFCLRDKKKVTG